MFEITEDVMKTVEEVAEMKTSHDPEDLRQLRELATHIMESLEEVQDFGLPLKFFVFREDHPESPDIPAGHCLYLSVEGEELYMIGVAAHVLNTPSAVPVCLHELTHAVLTWAGEPESMKEHGPRFKHMYSDMKRRYEQKTGNILTVDASGPVLL